MNLKRIALAVLGLVGLVLFNGMLARLVSPELRPLITLWSFVSSFVYGLLATCWAALD